MHARRILVLALAAAALPGCGLMRDVGLAPVEADPAALRRGGTADQPSHVVVRHVLISFDDSGVPGVTRSKDEAAALARTVLAEARGGRDFAELIRLYSDDRAGDGTYSLANWGVPTEAGEVERRRMVRGFGALAFTIEPGQFGIVEYDVNTSPFGWHVVERVR